MPFSKTLLALLLLAFCPVLHAADQRTPYEASLFDESRRREIPLLIYSARAGKDATRLALISGGNGMPPSAYGFIARKLVDEGYLVAFNINCPPTHR